VLIIGLALFGDFILLMGGIFTNSFNLKTIQLYSFRVINQKNVGILNRDHFLSNIFIVWLILLADVSLIFWSKKKEVFSKKPKTRRRYKRIKNLTIGIGVLLSSLNLYLWHIF